MLHSCGLKKTKNLQQTLRGKKETVKIPISVLVSSFPTSKATTVLNFLWILPQVLYAKTNVLNFHIRVQENMVFNMKYSVHSYIALEPRLEMLTLELDILFDQFFTQTDVVMISTCRFH